MTTKFHRLSKNAGKVYIAECVSGEMKGWHKYGVCIKQALNRRMIQLGNKYNGKYVELTSCISLSAIGFERMLCGIADSLSIDRKGEHFLADKDSVDVIIEAFCCIRDAEIMVVRAAKTPSKIQPSAAPNGEY